jgi:Spy/CpxP family protein refolding chaperone
MAKVKNLKKRIRRLEARLQKSAKKLAKLKGKLEAASTAVKTKPRSTASAEKARKSSNASAPIQKNQRSGGDVKPGATFKEPRGAGKKKRKLNLTPERRAQLAAAMKARWAAKRAAANTQHGSSSPGFSSGDASEPQ